MASLPLNCTGGRTTVGNSLRCGETGIASPIRPEAASNASGVEGGHRSPPRSGELGWSGLDRPLCGAGVDGTAEGCSPACPLVVADGVGLGSWWGDLSLTGFLLLAGTGEGEWCRTEADFLRPDSVRCRVFDDLG